jgi:hypothetical protein
MGTHDVAVCDMAVRDMAMHDVGMHSVSVYYMSLHSMNVPGSKKTIFNAHLGGKTQQFSLLYGMSLNNFFAD